MLAFILAIGLTSQPIQPTYTTREMVITVPRAPRTPVMVCQATPRELNQGSGTVKICEVTYQ